MVAEHLFPFYKLILIWLSFKPADENSSNHADPDLITSADDKGARDILEMGYTSERVNDVITELREERGTSAFSKQTIIDFLLETGNENGVEDENYFENTSIGNTEEINTENAEERNDTMSSTRSENKNSAVAAEESIKKNTERPPKKSG